MALVLAARFTNFPLRVDLVGQVHPNEALLLSLGVHVPLNLLKCLLWAKVGLVIKRFDCASHLLVAGLLSDLVLDEFLVNFVLHPFRLSLLRLDAVHPVDSRVEVILLRLTDFLHILDLLGVASQGHLVGIGHGFVRPTTFMG